MAISPLATLHRVTWECVREADANNENMHLLITHIEDGLLPTRHELPPPLQPYYQYREHSHSTDGVILYKGCVVILPCIRQEVYPLCSPLHNLNDCASIVLRRLVRDHFRHEPAPTAHTATKWYHPNLTYHQHPSLCRYIQMCMR